MSTHSPTVPTVRSASSCPFHAAFGSVRSAGGAGGIAAAAYGLVAYLAFFFWFLYAIGWLGNWFVPKSIDSGATGPFAMSLLINFGLVLVFALQHTIMARPAFKRWWTRLIPPAIERSTFVLVAAGLMWLLVLAWRPMPQAVWSVEGAGPRWALNGLSLAGWGLVLLSSFLINHFDLFGLRQVWFRLTGRPYRPVGFRLVGPYRLVRHPLMLGFLIAFWAAPTMTVGRLVFAGLFTMYILFGTWIEERDLVAEHGERYTEYQRTVRGLIPIPRRGI